MDQTIRIFKSIEQLAQYFATKFAFQVSETPEGQFFTIALSGGSSPKVVFSYIAEHFKNKIDWKKVLIFWGDERCVLPESHESNFRMTKESLLDHIPIPSPQVFRIRGEEDPVEEAERYSEIVKQNIPSRNGIPVFDIIILGLGDDGHTASIFPLNSSLFSSEKLFEPSENPSAKQKRITVTGQIINHSREVIFLVTGKSKAEIVAGVIEKKQGYEKLPASMVSPLYGNLLWLLDEPAASDLHDSLKNISKE